MDSIITYQPNVEILTNRYDRLYYQELCKKKVKYEELELQEFISIENHSKMIDQDAADVKTQKKNGMMRNAFKMYKNPEINKYKC